MESNMPLGRAVTVLATAQAHEDIPRLPAFDRARLPHAYKDAKQALERCLNVDECKSWADKAAALASYAKQAKDSALSKMAIRIRARAIRRCGELLKAVEPGRNQYHARRARAAGGPGSRKDAALKAGLSRRQAKQAMRVASVPVDRFGKLVESDNPPTVHKLAKEGTVSKATSQLSGRRLVRAVERFERELNAIDLATTVARLPKRDLARLHGHARHLSEQLARLGRLIMLVRKASPQRVKRAA